MALPRLGVDVGGTFTDVVLAFDGRIVIAKVPSTPEDQSRGVMDGCRAAGIPVEEVEAFAHGTTVATNALLERKGAAVALLTTDGFKDVLEIGRQNRAALYDLTARRPPPLVPRDRRFTVTERMGPDGPVVPLDEDELAERAADIAACEPDAVAVCFLFSYLHPEHERRALAVLRRTIPDAYVTASSAVLPEFREFERFSTTAADAYLVPGMRRYLRSLIDLAGSIGLPDPLVMLSSGGVAGAAEASERAAACVLSGPAGGVVGASVVSGWSGFADVLSFDMGGTSTDVASIVDGVARDRTDAVIGGVPIRFPMVDVHTVGAGGGSIAWVDEGGALRVGPQSAGAVPGPVCYQRGGDEPTVTDANLMLGYLEDGARLGHEVEIRREPAEEAIARLGKVLELDPVEAAAGIRKVSNAEILRALRVISVERGIDPRSFALCAFGGAGPLHACELAADLGIRTVLIPRASGMLSALGLALSDLRRDVARAFPTSIDDLDPDRLQEAFRELEEEAARGLKDAGFVRRADLRYRGQAYELTVLADGKESLADAFHEAHEAAFGYRVNDEEVEIVTLRVTATVSVRRERIAEPARPDAGASGRRAVYLDGSWTEAEVWARRDMGAGTRCEGPAIVELDGSTCLVPEGWSGVVDDVGTLVLEAS